MTQLAQQQAIREYLEHRVLSYRARHIPSHPHITVDISAFIADLSRCLNDLTTSIQDTISSGTFYSSWLNSR